MQRLYVKYNSFWLIFTNQAPPYVVRFAETRFSQRIVILSFTLAATRTACHSRFSRVEDSFDRLPLWCIIYTGWSMVPEINDTEETINRYRAWSFGILPWVFPTSHDWKASFSLGACGRKSRHTREMKKKRTCGIAIKTHASRMLLFFKRELSGCDVWLVKSFTFVMSRIRWKKRNFVALKRKVYPWPS